VWVYRFKEFGQMLIELKGGFLLKSMSLQEIYPAGQLENVPFAAANRNYEAML